MKVNIKNKNLKSCLICQNEEASDIIDPLLFGLTMNYPSMVMNLEAQGICVEEEQLREHSHHIFAEKPKKAKDETMVDVRDRSNLDMVKDTLATITALEMQYIDEGAEFSPEMTKLWATKQKFMEQKAKMEGDLVENINVVIPEWIKYIDADVSEPRLLGSDSPNHSNDCDCEDVECDMNV